VSEDHGHVLHQQRSGSDPCVQAGLQEAERVVEALRGALYRAFLRQMLTPEPDWLPHHYPQVSSAPLPLHTTPARLLVPPC
jgi:hypothetical protein